MRSNNTVLDNDEMALLDELEYGDFVDKPLSNQEIKAYKNHAKYTKSLREKKQTTKR